MTGFLGFPEGELDGVEVTPAEEFAGVPDEIQRTWVPHRMTYINDGGERAKPEAACAFCEVPKKTDEDGLVVYRGELAYVVMNLYPYNSGHLLVCPYRHVAMYDELTDEELFEIGKLTQHAMGVLRRSTNAGGFNIGMNQGSVAGAGIAEHFHQHIVPRWFGDANFMPIIGKTKPVPQLLGDLRALLAKNWDAPVATEVSGTNTENTTQE
ncbi:HIT family protein [Gulosibacter chungangensis]|uniref:HIT domain-containing protein n=1 Tax=Gulosibacter chungangensis TaxID=979746 RepID=A0A7J5BCV8_9MICO|nr:HIT domain-containing protein [Gulosibacter chungangensis]KAB1644048.1 HIT domain-containing protein [Gulosibacter chungangensis]